MKFIVGLTLAMMVPTAVSAQTVTAPIPTGYAYSQQNPSPPTTTALAVTSTSAALATISAIYPLVQVQNPTTSPACVALGGTSVTTPTPCPQQNQVAAGQVGLFANPSGLAATKIAGILLNSGATGTLQISEGYLAPQTASTPSGTVTVAPQTGTGAYSTTSVGTSSSVVLAASAAKTFVDLINDSQTATICLSIGGTPTITGTQCGGTGGLVTLSPLWHKSFPDPSLGYLPTDAISAIASASSTPLTVGAK